MKRMITIILCFCLLLLPVSSCKGSIYHKEIPDTVQYLSSNELEGRLPNTEGNRLAKSFIENSLAHYQVPPYFEGGYRQAYPFQELSISTAIVKAGDLQLSYPQGFQLIDCPAGKIDIASKLCTSPMDAPCVVLSDITHFRKHLDDPHVQAAIVNFENIEQNYTIYEQNIRKKPVVIVENDMYQKLLAQAGEKVEINIQGDAVEHCEENIIGKLAAAENPSNEAVVVSAHFDHLGSYGDLIYHGALDNASGVASLLEIVQIFSQEYDLTALNRDVVFAFFNTEETGLSHSGSRHFSELIEKDYTSVYNLNIDCIGENGKELIIGYTNDTVPAQAYLAQRASAILNEYEIPAQAAEQFGSDHVNFQNSLCLTTGFENANTLGDTSALMDFEAIADMTTGISALTYDLAADPVPLFEHIEGSALSYAPEFPAGLYCEAVEADGQLTHFMSGSFSAMLNPISAISKREPALSSLYPLHLEPLVPDETSAIVYTRAALRAGVPSALENSAPLPLPASGVCPYTGLTLEEHVPGYPYQGQYRLNDIGLITFTLPDRLTVTDTSVQIDQLDLLSIACYDAASEGDRLLYEEGLAVEIAAAPDFVSYNGYEITFSENHQQLIATKTVGDHQFLIRYRCIGPQPVSQDILLQRDQERGIFKLCDAFLEAVVKNP